MTPEQAKETVCPLFAIARGSDAAKCLAERCHWWEVVTDQDGGCAVKVLATSFMMLFQGAAEKERG